MRTATKFNYLVQHGCFDLLHPKQESYSVHIEVPGFPIVNLDLQDEGWCDDATRMPWPTLAIDSIDWWLKAIWVSSDIEPAKQIKAWLQSDDDHHDLYYDAWRDWRLVALCRSRDRAREQIAKLTRWMPGEEAEQWL